MAAEAEGVVHGVFGFAFAGVVGDEVEVEGGNFACGFFGAWVVEVDGGGDDVVAHGVDAGDAFECAAGAEAMAVHALGAAHEQVAFAALAGMIAEDFEDGVAFGLVAQGRAGAVAVDVVDLIGVQACVGHGHAHAVAGADAAFVGSGDVIGIAAVAEANEFGVDGCAALLGVLFGFENEHRAAFAQDEAVAINIEGAAGFGGFVVAAGESLHRHEGAKTQGRTRGFGSAGDHDIDEASAEIAHGVAYGMAAAGARRSVATGGAAEAVANGDVARGGVGHELGNGEGIDAVGAFANQRGHAVFDGTDAADARANDDAAAIGVLFCEVDARVIDSFDGGAEGEVGEAIHAFGFAHFEDGGWVPVFDLAADADAPFAVENCKVLALDLRDAAAAFAHGVPGVSGVEPDIADCAKTGDDDAMLAWSCHKCGDLQKEPLR